MDKRSHPPRFAHAPAGWLALFDEDADGTPILRARPIVGSEDAREVAGRRRRGVQEPCAASPVQRGDRTSGHESWVRDRRDQHRKHSRALQVMRIF